MNKTITNVFHTLLVLGLAGFALESRIQNLVTPREFGVIDLIFVALILIVFYGQQIEGGTTIQLPPNVTNTGLPQNPAPGTKTTTVVESQTDVTPPTDPVL